MKNKPCPCCHEPANRAIWGIFPIWICTKCEAEDSCVPFGFWMPIAFWLVEAMHVPCFAFLLCNDEPFWYLKGMSLMLFHREEISEE